MVDQGQPPKPQDWLSGKPQPGVSGATQTSGSKGQERLHGIKETGSVGRDMPDESKERHTEIAVEAGPRIATLADWPLILIDLYTEEGVIGRAYLEPQVDALSGPR